MTKIFCSLTRKNKYFAGGMLRFQNNNISIQYKNRNISPQPSLSQNISPQIFDVELLTGNAWHKDYAASGNNLQQLYIAENCSNLYVRLVFSFSPSQLLCYSLPISSSFLKACFFMTLPYTPLPNFITLSISVNPQ